MSLSIQFRHESPVSRLVQQLKSGAYSGIEEYWNILRISQLASSEILLIADCLDKSSLSLGAKQKLFCLLTDASISKLRLFTPLELCVIAKIACKDPATNQKLLKEISSQTQKNITSFSSQDLANMAWVFARFHILDGNLFSKISGEFIKKVTMTRPHDIAVIAWAFAKLNFQNSDIFQAITHEVIKDITRFDFETVALISWSFVIVNLEGKETEFLKLLLQNLEEKLASSPCQPSTQSLFQVYEVFLAMPEVEKIYPRLLQKISEMAIDRPTNSSQMHLEVFRLLRESKPHIKMELEHIWRKTAIDIFFDNVAIEVNGPCHYSQTLDGEIQKLGPTLFKEKILTKNRLLFIEIPFYEWTSLKKEEKTLYLDRKLSKQNAHPGKKTPKTASKKPPKGIVTPLQFFSQQQASFSDPEIEEEDFVDHLVNTPIQDIRNLDVSSLARLSTIIATLNPSSANEIFHAIQISLTEGNKIEQAGPQDLLHIVSSFSKQTQPDSLYLDQICLEIIKKVDLFENRDLIKILAVFSTFVIPNKERLFLTITDSFIAKKALMEFTSQELTEIALTTAVYAGEKIVTVPFLSAFSSRLVEIKKECSLRDLSIVTFALNSPNISWPEKKLLFLTIKEEFEDKRKMKEVLDSLSLLEISDVAKVAFSLKHFALCDPQSVHVLEMIAMILSKKTQKCTNTDLFTITTIFAETPLPKSTLDKVFKALSVEWVNRNAIFLLNHHQMVKLLKAYSKVDFLHPPLFEAVAKKIESSWVDYDIQEVVVIVSEFVTLEIHAPEVFRLAQEKLEQNLNNFQLKDLYNLAVSYAKSPYLDKKIIERIAATLIPKISLVDSDLLGSIVTVLRPYATPESPSICELEKIIRSETLNRMKKMEQPLGILFTLYSLEDCQGPKIAKLAKCIEPTLDKLSPKNLAKLAMCLSSSTFKDRTYFEKLFETALKTVEMMNFEELLEMASAIKEIHVEGPNASKLMASIVASLLKKRDLATRAIPANLVKMFHVLVELQVDNVELYSILLDESLKKMVKLSLPFMILLGKAFVKVAIPPALKKRLFSAMAQRLRQEESMHISQIKIWMTLFLEAKEYCEEIPHLLRYFAQLVVRQKSQVNDVDMEEIAKYFVHFQVSNREIFDLFEWIAETLSEEQKCSQLSPSQMVTWMQRFSSLRIDGNRTKKFFNTMAMEACKPKNWEFFATHPTETAGIVKDITSLDLTESGCAQFITRMAIELCPKGPSEINSECFYSVFYAIMKLNMELSQNREIIRVFVRRVPWLIDQISLEQKVNFFSALSQYKGVDNFSDQDIFNWFILTNGKLSPNQLISLIQALLRFLNIRPILATQLHVTAVLKLDNIIQEMDHFKDFELPSVMFFAVDLLHWAINNNRFLFKQEAVEKIAEIVRRAAGRLLTSLQDPSSIKNFSIESVTILMEAAKLALSPDIKKAIDLGGIYEMSMIAILKICMERVKKL